LFLREQGRERQELSQKESPSPSNILAVTFTNKASNEMKQRVARLVQKEARNLWIGTFHSTCLRILKREINKLDGYSRDFIIYDDADQIKLIRDCMVRLNIGERLLSPKHVRSQIDSAKNKGLGPDSSELNDYDKHVLRIYSLYEVELRKSNALDFGDSFCDNSCLSRPCSRKNKERSPRVFNRFLLRVIEIVFGIRCHIVL